MLRFGRRLREFWWHPSVDREVTDELDFHVEMRTRELVTKGMDPDAARAEATRRLGDAGSMKGHLTKLGKERDRTMGRSERWGELGHDLRFGFRTLARQPGFALVAMATLALGIGATTSIFSVLNTVVLRPLPVPDAAQVVAVSEGWRGGAGGDVSIGNFEDFFRSQHTFTALGSRFGENYILTGADRPERLVGARVTASYFRVMGVTPLHGRVFSEEEDSPGQPRTVVLSHRLWTRRFGANPSVIGQTLLLNTVPHDVLGVMPRVFDRLGEADELWTPAAFTPQQRAEHDGHFLSVYGRLKPGVTPAQAAADLAPIAARLRESYPDANHSLSAFVVPMLEAVVGDIRGRIVVLFGAVSLVLLIGCVNVANLLLARGAGRTRELAVRAALGAGRGRIVRQLFTENLVLALGASGLGIGLALVGVRLISAAAPDNVPRLDDLRLDLAGIGFAVTAALVSSLFFGLLPAVRTARADLFAALREGSRGASGRSRDWLKQGLVATEVGLAMLLLVGAGLLIRTAIHLGRVDPGFDPAGVLSARVSLPLVGYEDAARVTATFTRIEEELNRRPGVVLAALVSQVPMGPGGGGNGLIPEGKTLEGRNAIMSRLRMVTPGYLGTMRIPLKRGRYFSADDRRGWPLVMIINETLAQTAFPGQDPIGRRMACCEANDSAGAGAWKEIVGVVGDVRSAGLTNEAEAEFYLPMEQVPPDAWNWVQRTMTIAVRTAGDPAGATPILADAVRAADPSVPIFQVATMDQRIGRSLAESRFNTQLLTVLGGLGLGLVVVGIYGVIAFFVARRTREIGIRAALGASRASIRGMVVREGLVPVLAGVGLGTVASLAVMRLLAGQLRGVSATDPVTILVVAACLVAVATGAMLIPAMTATRIDATVAMREE